MMVTVESSELVGDLDWGFGLEYYYKSWDECQYEDGFHAPPSIVVEQDQDISHGELWVWEAKDTV